MDPMTIMAIASIIGAGTNAMGMMKNNNPGQSLTQPVATKLGNRPPMSVGNPYQQNIMGSTINQNPNDPYRRYLLSSTLGRYGGLV